MKRPRILVDTGPTVLDPRPSSPDGGGRRGYRAGHPRASYAQPPAVHGGRDPAVPGGGHIPRRGRCDLPAGGRSGAAAAHTAAWRGPCAEPAALPTPPRGGRGRQRRASASATCGAPRDGALSVASASFSWCGGGVGGGWGVWVVW